MTKSFDELTRRGTKFSRRDVFRGGAVAGAAALLGNRTGRALAQNATPSPSASPVAPPLPTFSGNAKITSWGFGVEETNPLAFSRVDAFKQQYPNIEIEIVPEFDSQKLLTGAASGNVPDVLWLDRFSVASWAARGVLSSIDDMNKTGEIDFSQYYDAAVNEAKYDGTMYAVPQFMDVRALYVNNDAVSAAGTDPSTIDTSNWDQLSQLGGQLVKKSGDKVDVWGFDHKMEGRNIWMWGFGNGGKFVSDDGKELSYNDPKIVEVLDWGTKAYDAQGGMKLLEAVATTWQGDEQFARAQVAMTIYESWMLGIVARVAPDLNFTVMPLKVKGGQDDVSWTGGPAWAIPAKAKNPEAAWVFIQFMSNLNTWRIGAKAVKDARTQANQPYIPALTGNKVADQMQINEFYESIDPKFDNAVKLFPELLNFSYNRPISASPVGQELDDILDASVKSALRGEKSAQDALDEANDKGQQAINDFQP
jgi:ABC-type glycerol-3-phosphate transport system substrate-binding protein